jgi:twitching motility protein PilT
MSVLHELLAAAVAQDASDVHLKAGAPPLFRVHGTLSRVEADPLTREDLETIIRDLLPQHAVRSYETEHEADFSHQEKDVGRFRVNVFNSQSVPSVSMRHVRTDIPTFEQLHLPPQLADVSHIERGIVILSGTTGSGKSTTLAAMIGEINRTERCRIITVEDPVEYLFTDDLSVISQREVGLDTLSFRNALKHLMRQDPDVILIGEMRDDTSIRTALLAAETGHLVLSTLHSGTADLAVSRMLDVFPADEQDQIRMGLAANLHAVICQRLVPAVAGGVIPAVEIMINTSTVRKLLEKNQLSVLAAAIETGNEDGMQTFNQSIYRMIKDGAISEEDGLRFATNPESLRMNLNGIFLDEGRRILGS